MYYRVVCGGLEAKKNYFQATVEITQHLLDRSASGLGKTKEELEQSLTEEREASETILEYLNRHYSVREFITDI